MKKPTREVTAGDRTQFGDEIVATRRCGNKLVVTIKSEKTGELRQSEWNYWGTVFLKDPQSCAK